MQPTVINIDYFKKVALGNPQFALEIIDRIIEKTEDFLPALQVALNNRDFKEIKALVQQSKSSAMLFAVNDLVAKIRKVELASQTKFDDYRSLVVEIHQDTQSFLHEIRLLRNQFENK